MRRSVFAFLAGLAVMAAASQITAVSHDATVKAAKTAAAIPMILQSGEGDQLVHRAGPLKGVPFTIKVDSQFGNSEDFFVFSEKLAAGQTIPFHKHENAEELLIFQEEGATVTVGDKRGLAGAESLVFIPRETWISAVNTSKKDIHLLAIFSRHGFETYMRAISVKPGEAMHPLTPDELARLRSSAHAVYWDSSKGAFRPVWRIRDTGWLKAPKMGRVTPCSVPELRNQRRLRVFSTVLK